MASPLVPRSPKNEYGISLMLMPSTNTDTILHLLQDLLKNEKFIDTLERPTWIINGWKLELKNNHTVDYYAQSTRTIWD